MVLATLITIGLLGVSCEQLDPSDLDISVEQVTENMGSGTWRVSLFEESGKDETNHFAGYQFSFLNGGILSASSDAVSFEGIWSITDSNSSDDSSDDIHFNIYFNLSNDFEDLNDDWDIISNTVTKIELIDASGGNGGTDYLTFERNQ
jgi:hypothetical protein